MSTYAAEIAYGWDVTSWLVNAAKTRAAIRRDLADLVSDLGEPSVQFQIGW